MPAKLLMLPANRAFNSNGLAIPGAQAFLYEAGTLTPANFYADAGLATSLGTSITANGAGRFDTAYQDGNTAFRLIVKDAAGITLDDIDPYHFGTTVQGAKGDPGSAGEGYATRSAMAAASATNLDDAYLTEPGREGKFVFSTANLSAQVTADTRQGIYIAPTSDPTGASGAWVRQFSVGIAMASWFGAVADGTTNDAPAINAALSQSLVSTVLLPAGTIGHSPKDGKILIPSGKGLYGAGPGRTTIKVLAGGYGASTSYVVELAQSGLGTRASDFTIDGGYVGHSVIGDPGTAGSRIMGVLARGKNFLVENVTVKNLWGYGFWANGGSASTLASGIFRNVHVDNANVQFETTHAGGVTFDGFTGTSGDAGASPYANLGNEFIHPIANSSNVTYANGRFEGNSGAPISISVTGANQVGIFLDNIVIRRTSTGAGQAAVVAGNATYTNKVKMRGVYIYQAGDDAGLAVNHSTVELEGCYIEGGIVAVSASVEAIIEATGSTAIGRGTASNTSFGILADASASVTWNGNVITAIDGGGGAVPFAGPVSVSAITQISPAGASATFNEDISISGDTFVGSTAFESGQLRVSGQSNTNGNTARITLDSGANGGQVALDSVLDAGTAFADFVLRCRDGGGMTEQLRVNSSGGVKARLSGIPDYADDAAAAAGGVAIGQFYRNGSVLMIRAA
jgi:hypothetical protein